MFVPPCLFVFTLVMCGAGIPSSAWVFFVFDMDFKDFLFGFVYCVLFCCVFVCMMDGKLALVLCLVLMSLLLPVVFSEYVRYVFWHFVFVLWGISFL